MANVVHQAAAGVEPFQIGRHAADDGVGRDALLQRPRGQEGVQGAERQRIQVPLAGQPAEERRLAALQRLHGAHLGAADHQNHLRVLEVLVPGVLQGREHGGVELGGVGQLVQDQDVAPRAEVCRRGLPQLGPALEGWGLPNGQAEQAGIELAPLQRGRLLLSRPVGVFCLAGLGPMAQQGCLAHPPAAVEEDELRRSGMLASQDGIQEGQLLLAVDEHWQTSNTR